MEITLPEGLECVPLDSSVHDRELFDCDDPNLTRFIRQFASQAQKKSESQTYVLVASGGSGKRPILGFLTLVASEFYLSPNRPPAPALVLARMAIDIRHQGKGYGKILVGFALCQAVLMSSIAGCVGVLVDAKPGKEGFYRKLGFTQSQSAPARFVMTLKQIRARLGTSVAGQA